MDRLAQPREVPTAAPQKTSVCPAVAGGRGTEDQNSRPQTQRHRSILGSSGEGWRQGTASPRFPATEELKAKLPKIKRFRTPSLL